MATTVILSPGAAAQLANEVKSAIAKITEDVATDARGLAPVKTGKLRSSIDTSVSVSSDGVTGTVSSNSGYGAYVELGTSRAGAQPFLKPAAYKKRSV